jgi:hypothetical protein
MVMESRFQVLEKLTFACRGGFRGQILGSAEALPGLLLGPLPE